MSSVSGQRITADGFSPVSAKRISIGGFTLPLSGPGVGCGPSSQSGAQPGDGSVGSDDPQALVITRGLPGCGKTTQARGWVKQGGQAGRRLRARVGRDTIRRDLFEAGVIMHAEAEEVVTRLQQQMVVTLLAAGVSVVVDDTNLPDTRMQTWNELAADAGVEVRVWDMRDVPIEVCIARDAARGAAGGHMLGAELIRHIAGRASASWERPS